jgi:hypothetical protein
LSCTLRMSSLPDRHVQSFDKANYLFSILCSVQPIVYIPPTERRRVMRLVLEWANELPLTGGQIELNKVPEGPGIYVFGRRHGKSFEALYVGRATNLKQRITYQLNNLKLMKHIDSAKTGDRVILIGLFRAKQKQTPEACLPIIERAVIRHFIGEGNDLVNIQGTMIREHVVTIANHNKIPRFPEEMIIPND